MLLWSHFMGAERSKRSYQALIFRAGRTACANGRKAKQQSKDGAEPHINSKCKKKQ